MEGEWSCYGGGKLNKWRMIMLERWSVYCWENGHVTEVVTKLGRMLILQRWV